MQQETHRHANVQTQINTSYTQTLNSKSDIEKPTARLKDTPSDKAVNAEVWESQEVESRLVIVRLDLDQLFHAYRQDPDRLFQSSLMTSFLFRSLNSPSQSGPFSETLPITGASGGQRAMQGWGWGATVGRAGGDFLLHLLFVFSPKDCTKGGVPATQAPDGGSHGANPHLTDYRQNVRIKVKSS